MKLKTAQTWMCICAGLAIFFAIAAGLTESMVMWGLLILSCVATIVIQLAFNRCPHCKQHLGRGIGIGNYCPNCGKQI